MKKLFTFYVALALTTMVNANNIAISNLSLTGKNTGSHYTMVQFDISWENSWRTSSAPNNWDAAWVFVKYRVSGGAWQHAWLNDDGHTAPAGSSITPGFLTPGAAFNATSNPGLGAFIYRSADGAAGTFSKSGVLLRWNYGANGVADGDNVEIKVFAIEMVYVPQGAFTLGSGGTESGSLTNGSWAGGATVPLPISSESELTIAHSAGNLWGTSASGNNTIGDAGTLAAAFPKGYAAFYCMKYEISQQQYVDFLNTITSTQASNRYSPGNTGHRYGIAVSGGAYSTTNPYVACNYLSWMDGAAYTDWAGLRPMTELEFEKACRGNATPVAGEYAWGNTTATSAKNITNGGAGNETTNTPGANAVFFDLTNAQDGPMRTGVFATGTTTRVQAGDTYYGIMEMSGNLWERAVTVGNATGRAFTGVHGNGTLSAAGYADISTWPGYNTAEVTGATGSGFRGGSFLDNYIRVSDRFLGTFDYPDRFNNDGFRAVRTQPPFTCGISTFTNNHVTSGGVAPVDKTVTYGTVSTTLFGGTKCAITRNLGASQQATAANDATEASAGWYWQFNRKQGYKADCANGSTCAIPAWTITYIYETSDWTAANDPCAIELGTGWRIPTHDEWQSASASWQNENNTYGSVLKLHNAGALLNGTLFDRGPYGYYWNSTQFSSSSGWLLVVGPSVVSGEFTKAAGASVRCLKDMLPTLTTTAVTTITYSTATSGGNVTDDGGSAITARGVCWSTSTGPTTALTTKTADGTGTGSFTSAITGLTSGTLYYIRAYATNNTGTSYGNEISFTTLGTCGSFTISHVSSGGVAPVDKTTTYGTVFGIPGLTTKCWITSNLGSDRQATAVNDATEASAGWYWQFNRRQGYKHDGSARTPNTTWITPVSESSDWMPANDPCALELGAGWRIPSLTEWTNVDAGGGWTTWDGPWNSGLKMHAAGYLVDVTGSLNWRGSNGYYWSSTQASNINGQSLEFRMNLSAAGSYQKADGFPLRCLRDKIPTVSTTVITNVTNNTATGGGNVISECGSAVTERGVCWSTSTGPTTALMTKTTDGTGTGTFISSITELAASTTYYVRAYATNSVGTAYGNEVIFTTPAFTCGSTFTNNHVTSGGVAPVDKTVTYGTVSTTLFGGTKCAITRNLGASQQATAANDATEASAGWYWQFNRKQGYKADCANGSTCAIPAWTITYIYETSDWTAANDPCAIELGTGWRIPTHDEWQSASASWQNENNTYGSVLKLHNAGALLNGTLFDRGPYGYYWNSTQFSSSSGWLLVVGPSVVSGEFTKAAGASVRCLKDMLPTLTTTAVTTITYSTATSGGNVTDDGGSAITARGVCWSTSTGPTTALTTKTADGTGTGSFTSAITGLTSGTLYYIRTYATNNTGTSYGNEISFTTLGTCGSFTISHVSSGGVAPVDKTTTYGTVFGIPGLTTKCWITSNLGSDRQATAVNDATEASAGWYWQFNRKQGYKHDGSTRTPNTTWITPVSESSDWMPANDPCALELGTGWRIPSLTEWTNVDAGGGWTTWDGPWNSGLKMHAAGYLVDVTGSLNWRGSNGYYWSSTQATNINGQSLEFRMNLSAAGSYQKADGFPLRCLRDKIPTVSTTVITNVTNNTATGGGNVISGCGSAVTERGVCWSTTTGPTTALTTKTTDGSGPGTFMSSITGLAEGTPYYVRAYATNGIGTAYGNEVIFTTDITCGSSITVNHVAGTVAPVDKTTAYGTVTNIPGELSKCWITSNLGSDHEATSVSDGTEASAGWYWQFNRKQGYKNDGSVTPSWSIININESSDWMPANDPCTIELGFGWHIPTRTEWTNVVTSGNWTNWDGPWGSGLKLHAAGFMNSSDGTMTYRGSYGTFWSSKESAPALGEFLVFSSGDLAYYGNYKGLGFSARCIRDH